MKMKIDTEAAEKLVLHLRNYSRVPNQTDKELVTTALRMHPRVSGIVFGALLFYHSANKAMPQHQLLVILVITVVAAVACWFTNRSLNKLQAIQNLFLGSAPNNLKDVLKEKPEQNHI